MALTGASSRSTRRKQRKCCNKKARGFSWCGTLMEGDCQETSVQCLAGPGMMPVTDQPTRSPAVFPTTSQSDVPSQSPTVHLSDLPTHVSSQKPSSLPTAGPTDLLSEAPSQTPSSLPTTSPTDLISEAPSQTPSSFLSASPTETASFSCIDGIAVPVDNNNQVLFPNWTCSGEECPQWPYSFCIFDGTVTVTQAPPPFTVLTGPQSIPGTFFASDGNITLECHFNATIYDITPPNITISGIEDRAKLLPTEFAELSISATAVDNVDSSLEVGLYIDSAPFYEGIAPESGRHAIYANSSDSSGNIGLALVIFEILDRELREATITVDSLNCSIIGNYSEIDAVMWLTSSQFDASLIDPETIVMWVIGGDSLALQNRPIFLKNGHLNNDTWILHFISEASDERTTGCPTYLELDGSSENEDFDFIASVYLSTNSGVRRQLETPSTSSSSPPSSSPAAQSSQGPSASPSASPTASPGTGSG
eukprot:CAMPEP_0113568860 /NCGR_PEP_ID=MMETSP0015_2-20120614/24084_1 /TAXON_ID=2838 /ORGANISM="Odontella" /LENGTH=478 /DNA_ID=CAMNT_0000471449 /DNA_START=290 /DNA_END=1723 /DNA_ORIENTATION=- /assembly_acc=CAM_ASM_000160